jgi:protocatechuate 3,4-dioxygenase alpha subunit
MYLDHSPDPVLENLKERGERLVAKKEGANRYRFDLRLRGEGETPFFDD